MISFAGYLMRYRYRRGANKATRVSEIVLITTETTEDTEGMEKDPLSQKVIGCAIEVHRTLGAGLLESTYQQCLAHELGLKGIPFLFEHPVPVKYKGVRLDCGYRIDILVNDQLILELKAVEELKPIHSAQLLTYMKLARIRTGLLINFNVKKLVDGIKRLKL